METEISNPQSAIRNPQCHIFLIGFMACGKSTVGPVLAAKLNRAFVDLDQLIEAKTGHAIAELITREGEESFRQIEIETLCAAAQGEPAVIAPGGGAMTRTENRELMLRHGITVWLDAPVELCWQRIRQDRIVRPLASDEESVRKRYSHRLPLYQQARIQVFINKSQSPEEIAEKVVDRLRRLEAG
ncbi:MAG: shikimate kinase [Blastocatellia bacterium]